MGTKALAVFVDEHGNGILTLYSQFDGIPEICGYKLARYMQGCLFSSIPTLAVEVGVMCAKHEDCIRPVAFDTVKDWGIQYNYRVWAEENGDTYMSCYDNHLNKYIYTAMPVEWIERYEGEMAYD